MRDLREALRCDPNHVPSLERKLAMLHASGDMPAALDCAKRLVDLNSGPIFWTRYRGEFLLRQDRMQEALEAFDRVIQMGTTDLIDYARRGQIERRLRRYDRALADLDKSIALAKDPYRIAYIYSFRATVHWILGHPDAAVADYERSSKLLPTPAHGAIRAAIILREQGRFARAELILRGIHNLSSTDSTNTEVEWLRAIAACISGDLTPGELVAKAQPGDSRGLCEACYYAAEASLAAGAIDQAREWFQHCLDTNVQMDPHSRTDPMSEFELAEWRLKDPRFARTETTGTAP